MFVSKEPKRKRLFTGKRRSFVAHHDRADGISTGTVYCSPPKSHCSCCISNKAVIVDADQVIFHAQSVQNRTEICLIISCRTRQQHQGLARPIAHFLKLHRNDLRYRTATIMTSTITPTGSHVVSSFRLSIFHAEFRFIPQAPFRHRFSSVPAFPG